jgi:peroxiredoxin
LRNLLKPNEPVTLWAISIDGPEESRGFSQKIEKIVNDGRPGIEFPLLSDPGSRTIDAYGLQDPRYAKLKRAGIPVPTAYVIDRAGRVAWTRQDQNWKVRPENAEIRAAFEALK